MAVVVLAVCAIVLPSSWPGSRPILRDVQRLEAERARLVDLYGRARQDSLARRTDRSRATIGRSRRSSAASSSTPPDTGRTLAPAARRCRRPQEGERRARSREGRRAPGSGLGRIIINAIRRGDRAFRVGGDEFAVILPNADIETGLVVARRMLASALNGGYAGGGVGGALLAVDRHLRVPDAEHPGQPALPARGRGAVLVQATWTDERGRLRPGAPRRLAGRALHRGRLRGAGHDPGRAVAPTRLPADLLDDDRRASSATKGSSARPTGHRCPTQHPVRGCGARRPDRRARHGLPVGRRRRAQRSRRRAST